MDYARRNVSAQDCEQVSLILKKILRGYECGTAMPPSNWMPTQEDFSVVPGEASGMGLWTENETRQVIQFIHAVMGSKPVFKRPAGRIGIAVETDEEWNEWVHEMLKQLLAIEELRFEQLRIISFVG
jgi:hypothetical protein